MSLAGKGAVLEKGIVYVARLMERLELRPNLSGAANPKSSTGRIDIFTRLIVDRGEAFDDVPLEYKGELWLEISPRSFSVRVRAGTKLNQVRFRSRHPQQRDRRTFSLDDADLRKRRLGRELTDGPLDLREGVVLRVDLGGLGEPVVGYRAIRNSDVIDVSRVGGYAIEDFWEPIHARPDRRLILDPDQFYILASREKSADSLRSRGGNGADRPGLRRVSRPLRRLLRSRLRAGRRRAPAPREQFWRCAAATCRSCSRTGSRSAGSSTRSWRAPPDALYGADATSSYQHQGLKLSKHFRL